MYLDNPSTYSQKYGIILQITRFNHNIQNIMVNKYKIMYIKWFKQNVYSNGFSHGYKEGYYCGSRRSDSDSDSDSDW